MAYAGRQCCDPMGFDDTGVPSVPFAPLGERGPAMARQRCTRSRFRCEITAAFPAGHRDRTQKTPASGNPNSGAHQAIASSYRSKVTQVTAIEPMEQYFAPPPALPMATSDYLGGDSRAWRCRSVKMPLGCSWRSLWNRRIASSVLAPTKPSGRPGSRPRKTRAC